MARGVRARAGRRARDPDRRRLRDALPPQPDVGKRRRARRAQRGRGVRRRTASRWRRNASRHRGRPATPTSASSTIATTWTRRSAIEYREGQTPAIRADVSSRTLAPGRRPAHPVDARDRARDLPTPDLQEGLRPERTWRYELASADARSAPPRSGAHVFYEDAADQLVNVFDEAAARSLRILNGGSIDARGVGLTVGAAPRRAGQRLAHLHLRPHDAGRRPRGRRGRGERLRPPRVRRGRLPRSRRARGDHHRLDRHAGLAPSTDSTA